MSRVAHGSPAPILSDGKPKYSSYWYHVTEKWPLPRPADWLQIVNQPQTEAEVAALRCCVNRGRPFGDPDWVTDTAKRLGLESTIRPRGRP